MRNKNQVFGDFGEEVARKFLHKKMHYKILATNERNRYGEVDIIALDKGTYVFVEVKTRASDDDILPEEAVNKTKQSHIIATAELYLDLKKLYDVDYRFDIIEVVGEKNEYLINHIIDAFA